MLSVAEVREVLDQQGWIETRDGLFLNDFARRYIAIVVVMQLGRKSVLNMRLHYSEKYFETFTTIEQLKEWLDNPNIHKIKKLAA